jgi:hypothetical protein
MPPSVAAVLADVCVTLHVAYVAYVVLGQLLIWAGWAAGWRWVRNFWFRLTHLIAIAIVAVEEVFQVTCPLTVWENRLREVAGQDLAKAHFMSRLMHDLIYLDLPAAWFTVLHFSFAAIVIGTFVLFPPRWIPTRQ